MGAALSIRVDGRPVANLWGGVADERTERTWTRQTPSVIFSCTKGLMSALLARLVDEGRLDYDLPLAHYWPEFAAGGKAEITVAQALSHRAGLSAPRTNMSLHQALDWPFATGELAAQTPLWAPGSGHAYHAVTHGWLTGELIRRITGKTAGQHLAEMTAPLGLDLWVGLPDRVDNTAHLQVALQLAEMWASAPDTLADGSPNWLKRATTLGRAFPEGLVTTHGAFNDRRVLAAEWPGAGGVATAEALASFWSATVTATDGLGPLLSPEVITRATRPASEGMPVFGGVAPFHRWGLGFMLDCEPRRLLTPRGFGHDGAGGQIGFADPDLRVGFGYVTNLLRSAPEPRGQSVIEGLRDILTA
jgi:CubicO group peptidase (beta-lactamase class C family)